ncbi:hypothetical protein, partial [Diaphorobacter sp. J5-51]|uniref:hypothetical protein n=1 Tax=Diaphorobacter sp. J5-51 TaxID=680496 RepID=UPI000642F0A7
MNKPERIPYDAAFKKLFSNRLVMEHLISGLIDPIEGMDLAGLLNFEKAQMLGSEYFGPHLRKRSNDIVWQLPLKEDGKSLLVVIMLE